MATIVRGEEATANRTFPPYRLSIAQYEQLATAGVLAEGDPAILWHGTLAAKMTKGRPHTVALVRLDGLLSRLVPAGWHVEQEQPMSIGDDGMPEPDLMIVRGTVLDFPDRPPTAQDVALIVEVADSSLPVDSGDVLETYAGEAIPVYWIVNLPKRRIEVHSRPTGPGQAPYYAEHHNYGPDDEVPVVLDGREVGRVAVREVLPP
jgi:Uma2 family endonuclease